MALLRFTLLPHKSRCQAHANPTYGGFSVETGLRMAEITQRKGTVYNPLISKALTRL